MTLLHLTQNWVHWRDFMLNVVALPVSRQQGTIIACWLLKKSRDMNLVSHFSLHFC